ncbi:MAG: GWxTD domain-containing protein [Candidatus Marinimicrobia bacterium]|jgi:GWxTD domain-containing protein|nr:GWxTD domain-containing protein [Candidatus Neomarinimicrobiota bacterium]MBT3634991.1 GWxTD domain-containing protein [Candidatus Neomarinimicrobiota bacterium]MBT3683822.1 GWxTD domain-containing protein [Candidatus Neomarinimicrobiota bacterium]MBT3760643.1 GWxTD domain-containing protein [Candidatus Neomarinimicrobiota bacterium]MBT3896832.1 GWxTD domain-containing protein [Candidatus Neomarinimicrobiota bacterium]
MNYISNKTKSPSRVSRFTIVVIILFSLLSRDLVYAGTYYDEPEGKGVEIVALSGIVIYFLWVVYDSYFGKEKKVVPNEVKKAISDLKFIATKNEYRELKKIREHDELKSFIYNFWLRRDPSPGTAANEFKVIHMNRVKIANEKYGWGLTPGADSDMGRVYILYGEPYNISSLDPSQRRMDDPDPFNVKNIGDASRGEKLIFRENSVTIWTYSFPSNSKSLPTIFDYLGRDETVFVFADLQKVGDYSQVYSNKSNEYIDPRVYK